MGYVLEPGPRMQREVRRVAAERLGDAIAYLDGVRDDPEHADLESAVHEVRKRCKASRGLARLVEPALGDAFRSFDRSVRDAANQLSSLRDAHAVLTTFDALLASMPDDLVLREVRNRQSEITVSTSRIAVADDDERISTARMLLADARDAARHWSIPRGFDTIEAGIATTYRQGRTALRKVNADPTDQRFHDWRKSVKYLWYQMQLVHDAAPSALGPFVEQLDRLAEMLGDEHDLTVLAELLDDRPDDYGTPSDVDHLREVARERQHVLREHAIRAGATIYAEPRRAFVHRIARYWQLAVDLGPERPDPDSAHDDHQVPARSVVERERKFLVDTVPDDLVRTAVVELRQGYLSVDQHRSVRPRFEQAAVRVRDAGPEGCTLTVKAGSGAERTELEWPIGRREFEAAWPHTEGRRVEKTRHRIPFGVHVVELDVFGGDLAGLIVAEVEFDTANAMDAFVPPTWFGRDVTDDGRYTNASLALDGLPVG